MPYLRGIWHFKTKNLLHQWMLNSSIANFFAILLQYNSKHRIVLFTNCKKNNNILFSYLPRNFSLIPLIFLCSSFSFSICSLFSETSSPKFLTHLRNFSPISHGHSLISHRTASHLSSHGFSLIAPVLGFGFLRLEVRSAWIDELGLDRWAGIGWWLVWISWSVGLKWWIRWSVGESFGLIIGSSDDDFWVFRRPGF